MSPQKASRALERAWQEELKGIEGGEDWTSKMRLHNIVEVEVFGGPLDGCVLRVPEAVVRSAASLEEIVRAAEVSDAEQ